MTCTNCQRDDTLYSGARSGKTYSDICERCIGVLGSAEFSRRYDRQYQRREYARDILQPGEPGYIKEYPNQARKHGATDADFRKFG